MPSIFSKIRLRVHFTSSEMHIGFSTRLFYYAHLFSLLCFFFCACLTLHHSQARSLLQAVLHPACLRCPHEGAMVAEGYLQRMQKGQLNETEPPHSLEALQCCLLATVHPSQSLPPHLDSTALTGLNGGQTHSCIQTYLLSLEYFIL